MDRLSVAGEMDVVAARFTDGVVQAKISNMSERARGLDPDAHADNVVSDLRAKFALDRGVLGLRDTRSGSRAPPCRLAGTYGLFNEGIRSTARCG